MLVTAVVAGLIPIHGVVPIEWDAPAGCPSQGSVQSWLDLLVAPTVRGRAHARVSVVEGRYRLRLGVTTPEGFTARDLDAEHCESLARAAVVIVAVAADVVDATTRTDGPGLPSLPTTPNLEHPAVGASPRAMGPVSAVASTPTRRPVAAALGAEAGVGTGLLPDVHAIGQLWVGIRWARLWVEATGTQRFGRVARQPAGGGARISLSGGGVRLGPRIRRNAWSVAVLMGIEGGVMVAAGQGLARTRTVTSPWLGASLRPTLSLALAPWVALQGALTLTGSLVQPRFRIDDGPLIHTTSPLGARVGLGLEFRIPLRQSARDRRPRE